MLSGENLGKKKLEFENNLNRPILHFFEQRCQLRCGLTKVVIYRYMKYYFVHQCLNLISLCVQTRFGMLGKVYSEFLFVVNQNYCCVEFSYKLIN